MSFFKKQILCASVLVSSVLLPCAAYADLQFEVYGGAGNVTGGFGSEYTGATGVNPPNTLGGSPDQWSFAPGFGVSYGFPMDSLTQIKNDTYILHDIVLGLNAYYLSTNYTGPVYINGDPTQSQANYNMGIDSWRVMLDGEFDVHPFFNGWVMPFGEAGIGDAINTMHYTESPTGVVLSPHTNNSLAYEFGGGVKVPVAQHANISLRYLYSNEGTAEGTATTGASSTNITQPLEVQLHSSSILLGFNYGLGSM